MEGHATGSPGFVGDGNAPSTCALFGTENARTGATFPLWGKARCQSRETGLALPWPLSDVLRYARSCGLPRVRVVTDLSVPSLASCCLLLFTHTVSSIQPFQLSVTLMLFVGVSLLRLSLAIRL